ncbi:hypothetical protein IBX73_07240 [candidate division WOR-3 bacterium]|nr:hypothetical protein [candidate division WOR-3 bacterium]
MILVLVIVWSATAARETGARYLIITHDYFYTDVLPLARWKHKKGMRTKVVTLTETGYTADAIRSFVLNAYNTWEVQPEYLLLVGAPNLLPMPTVGGTISDNYYTDMDGDMFNDILSGRLTVHNNTEAQTVVNKILLYERTPFTADSLWFRNACLIANEDYGVYPPVGNDTVYWNDVRHAKNLMLANEYHTIDTLSCGLGNNAASVIQAVNNGRGFVLYRGTGLNNWSSPFSVVPDQTANGMKLPIVLSITCCTMGTGATAAVAEKWLLTGTPDTPRGAAGYFATTTVGSGYITFLRSAVARGFFTALFLEGKQTFGRACEGGRRNVYALYNSASEYRGFTTLGDPEMNIWTGKPCSLVVNHPQVIPAGNANFVVNVARAAGSMPVNRAVVCISGQSDTVLYAVDSTDSAGNAFFSIHPQCVNDTVFVTVTGKNLKPYESTMVTITSTAYVVHLKSSIDDSLGGNNDGMINPGEQIIMPLWVKNYGDSTAHNVAGALRSVDPYASITDSVKGFGTVAGGDSAFTGSNGYAFGVAPGAPDRHAIIFQLACTDPDDSVWLSHFSKTVHAPDLIFLSAQLSGGNGNNTFEPGETVTVMVTVRNDGTAMIDTVGAILRATSPYVGIIDSAGTFPPMAPAGSATNTADPFIVHASAGTPSGTAAGFQLILNQGFYCDTLEFSLFIGALHYYVWNPDPTPAPGQNMHAILTALGYSGEHGSILPANLGLYQSVWVCCGVYPNNHVINSSSPQAAALVDYLQDQGGRMYLEGGDVWYYDVMLGGYDFCPLFGINAVADGSNNMGPVVGQASTFTAGMYFAYGGENSWMDHITSGNQNAFVILRDGNDYYDCGVAYNGGTYRTVGTSFELGLLTDGTPPSTRAALLDSIMHFFSITTGIEEDLARGGVPEIRLKAMPNPFRNVLHIHCQVVTDGAGRASNGTLCVYDVTGRLVREFDNIGDDAVIVWNGVDRLGRTLPNGVYFLQWTVDDITQTAKTVLLR